MATQSWVIAKENGVIEAIELVNDIVQAAELQHNSDGPIIPLPTYGLTQVSKHTSQDQSNLDCWGTLKVNLQVLQTSIGNAIHRIEMLELADTEPR